MSTNAERLAQAVKARRAELDLTQLEVWQAGGPSNTTQTTIEAGLQENLVRSTARKLDTGLRWEPGSARRVWDGTGEAAPAGHNADLVAEVKGSNLSPATKRHILEQLQTPPSGAPRSPAKDSQAG